MSGVTDTIYQSLEVCALPSIAVPFVEGLALGALVDGPRGAVIGGTIGSALGHGVTSFFAQGLSSGRGNFLDRTVTIQYTLGGALKGLVFSYMICGFQQHLSV